MIRKGEAGRGTALAGPPAELAAGGGGPGPDLQPVPPRQRPACCRRRPPTSRSATASSSTRPAPASSATSRLLGPDYRLLAAFKAGTETAVPEGYYVAGGEGLAARRAPAPERRRRPGQPRPARRRAARASTPGRSPRRTSTSPQGRLLVRRRPQDGRQQRRRDLRADQQHRDRARTARPWRDQRGALVQLTWWETIENTPGSRRYSALVTFVDQHADQPLAGQNPMGVWVSDFRPTLVEERR